MEKIMASSFRVVPAFNCRNRASIRADDLQELLAVSLPKNGI